MKFPVPVWSNIVPYIQEELGIDIPPLMHPRKNRLATLEEIARYIPLELAKQESNWGKYATDALIDIPGEVLSKYHTFRPTPLRRAKKLERALGLNVKLFYKDESVAPIGSYKINSAYVQAYWAKKEGVRELIADTGPGNWGMATALACEEFDLPLTVYMEKENYDANPQKVAYMRERKATVIPVSTTEKTIASSINRAIQHVDENERNKLTLGCLSAYSGLHNTIIGLELCEQLHAENINPGALIGVVGGGSSFSGFTFPLIKHYRGNTEFIAVESTSMPSFSQGEYRYENPDLLGIMPKTKMYTIGRNFRPHKENALGLNYHGKNPLLSLLVHEGIITTQAYDIRDAKMFQRLFHYTEGIAPSLESCFAIKGAIEKAIEWDNQDKSIIFLLTGKEKTEIS